LFFTKKNTDILCQFFEKNPDSIFFFVTYRIQENLHDPESNSISSTSAPDKVSKYLNDFRNGQDLVNTGKRICESIEDNKTFTSPQ